MKPERVLILSVVALGLVVHPLAGLLTGNGPGDSAAGYHFFTSFAFAPLAAHAVIAWALLRPARSWLPLRAALWADLLSAGVFSLGLQIVAWIEAPTDAQGAIAFVFVPMYAAIAAGIVGLAALGIASIFARR